MRRTASRTACFVCGKTAISILVLALGVSSVAVFLEQSFVSGVQQAHAATSGFSVQRGTARIETGNTATTVAAGVEYTAPDASSTAFIRITNTQHTGAGNDTGGGTQNAADVTVVAADPENILSDITFQRTGTNGNTRVSWEIVTYTGVTDGDNEFIVRDQDSVTFDAATLTATGTVVADIIDDRDVVVFVTGVRNPDTGTADYNTGLATAAWASSTDQPVFTRGEAGGDAVELSYAVVEFTGSNWLIQRAVHTYSATGTTETEGITAVNAQDHAFLHAQKRVGSGLDGVDEFGHEVWLSSIGAISFRLEAGADSPSEHTSVVWVIENTQVANGEMEVLRSNGTITSGGGAPSAHTIDIGDTINSLASTSIFVNNRSTGASTTYPNSILGVRLTSTTQYELWRSDTTEAQNYRTEVVSWPRARTLIDQDQYRFYVDNDTLTPTDPWPAGGSDLGENTSITSADEPPGEGDALRIRMSLNVRDASLPADAEAFKLQFGARDTTCSAVASWTDVGRFSSTTPWRGHNGTPSDGATLPGTLISISDVNGSYEETNDSVHNPFSISAGDNVEYDWLIEHNGALGDTDYCFRMVKADGTPLDAYNNYPTVRTASFSPVVNNWKWFDDEQNLTPTNALAGTNTAPIDIVNDNLLKLRTTIHEVAGASSKNVKFKLQYSEYSDFREVDDVVSVIGCQENSIWCYADGAGLDNATITESVLADADECTGAVGDGCGTHNETATTSSDHTHGAFDRSEYEFTIQHAGARVNTVYYFRLYDTVNDEPVQASSSDLSLVTEGASMTFEMSGIASSTMLEGVTTDISTTPSTISFGTLPVGTELEAAHRIVIDTNGTEGYRLLMYGTSDLQNAYGDSIAPTTGTNESPTSWATGCPSSLSGCFGYHSGDDLLEGGSTRFAADDTYAGLSSTTPQEIGFSSVPASSEVTDVIYKIEARELQAAGEYETGITYIAIPVF